MAGSIVWQSILAFIYRCAGAVVSFLFSVCFARMMSIEQYGVLSSLMGFSLIAAIASLVGQHYLVLRDISSLAARKHYAEISATASRALQITFIGGTAVTCAMAFLFVLGHGQMHVFDRWENATSLLLVLPLAVVELQSAIARALGSVNMALLPKDVLWRLLILLLGGTLFVASGQLVGAAKLFVIAAGILILLIALQQSHLRWLMEGHQLFRFAAIRSTAGLGATIRASMPYWVTGIATNLFAIADVVIVSVIIGPTAGGYYYAANRIALILDFFITAFAIPAAPALARLYDEDHLEEITRITSNAALLAFCSVLVGIATLAIAGDRILMIFGEAFTRSYGILMVLAAGQAISAYLGIGIIALNMTGHQHAAMRIMLISSAIALVAMIGATWLFGVWGSAVTATLWIIGMKASMAAYIYEVDGIDTTATAALCATIAHLARGQTK